MLEADVLPMDVIDRCIQEAQEILLTPQSFGGIRYGRIAGWVDPLTRVSAAGTPLRLLIDEPGARRGLGICTDKGIA